MTTYYKCIDDMSAHMPSFRHGDLLRRPAFVPGGFSMEHPMDNVIQFRPRPNSRREAEQMAETLVNAMCWPWLAWAETMEPLGAEFDKVLSDNAWDLYAKGLAIDTAPSEYCAPVDDSA